VVLSLILIYLVIIAPINHYKQSVAQQIQYNQSLLSLMQQAKHSHVKQAQRQPGKTSSIASLLQQSFKVEKITPTQVNIMHDKAEVKFEHVVFDDLAKWLVLLHTDYQLKIINANITRQKEPGIVSATLSVRT